VRDDAAEARVLQRGAALVRRFAVRHRAHDGHAIGDRGHAREVLAEAQPDHLRVDRAVGTAVFDRRVGLGVERLLLRQPAGQEDLDHRLRLRLAGRAARRLLRPDPQEPRQSEPESADEPDLKELTTIGTAHHEGLLSSRGRYPVDAFRAPGSVPSGR
jgi:hypothetical protein